MTSTECSILPDIPLQSSHYRLSVVPEFVFYLQSMQSWIRPIAILFFLYYIFICICKVTKKTALRQTTIKTTCIFRVI